MLNLTRRTFVGAATSAAATAAFIGAAPPGVYGPLTLQLPWVKNVEWAGSYFADQRGLYRAAGFSGVTLLGGGPGAPPVEAMIAAGRAFVAISSLAPSASAILRGATLKTIAVQYQTSPFIIASLADRPLRTPHDMIGKRIGVPGGNEPTWNAFLRVNAIDPASITVVTVGSTAAPLANRQIDGLLAFVTNVPHALQAQGIAMHAFGLGEFGYRLVNNNYIVTDETLRTQRGAVKAFLRAEVQGWKISLASPDLSARITVDDYGRDLGLTLADQAAQSAIQRTLIESPQTRVHGLFSMTPADVERNVRLLRASGITIDAQSMFDLSVLSELFAEDPALRRA
jgi:ABC-type nitrate/sulfonate/bicarbonate transport system substrate-binding protein